MSYIITIVAIILIVGFIGGSLERIRNNNILNNRFYQNNIILSKIWNEKLMLLCEEVGAIKGETFKDFFNRNQKHIRKYFIDEITNLLFDEGIDEKEIKRLIYPLFEYSIGLDF